MAGPSWEGYVIENLLAAAPPRTRAGFYRSAAGAEVDLVLELPSTHGLWAIEIKRALAMTLSRGFHSARADLSPIRTFVVNAGKDRYPLADGIEVIGLAELTRTLAAL